MKKYLILIIGLLFIAGCSSSDDTRSSGISGNTFEGGERALTMESSENTPPETIRDNGLQPFNLRFLIENRGEYDIEEGEAHLSLSGFSSSDLNIEDTSKSLQALRGVRKQGSNTIDGGRTQVTFSNLRYLPELSSGTHTQNIYANLCYPYKTEAVADLCVSGDTLVNYDEDNSICDLDSQRDFANSGGPVKIENVQQYPGGASSIEFQFDIVHTPTEDNGRAFKSGVTDSSCDINGKSPSSVDSSINEDIIQYKVEASSLRNINCNGEGNVGEVQLSDDTTTVYCSIDTTGEDEYETLIDIELSYDYLERISEELTIEHISQ